MTKFAFIILAQLFVINSVFSQTKSDSLKQNKNKNEIGIVNLIQFVNILTSPYTNSNHSIGFHQYYKRYIKNNWYARVGLSVSEGDSETNYKFTPLLNSQVAVYNYNYSNSNYSRIDLGIEKRYGKSMFVKQFFGLDLGYSNSKENITKTYGIRDSTFYLYSSGNDSLFHHRIIKHNIFSLTPFYGLKLNLSKLFFVSIQTGFDLRLSFNDQEFKINNNNEPHYYYQKELEANINLISTNISLGVHF